MTLKKNLLEISLFIVFAVLLFLFYDRNIIMIWGKLGSYGFYGSLSPIVNSWKETGFVLLLFNQAIIVIGFWDMFSKRIWLIAGLGLLFCACGYCFCFSWWQSIIVVIFFYCLLSIVLGFLGNFRYWLFFYFSLCLNAVFFVIVTLFLRDDVWIFIYSVVLTWLITINFYFKER